MSNAKWKEISVAMCGIVGVPTLLASFAINPGPPASAKTAQLMTFWASQHQTGIMMGGWMQVTGTLLSVLFALALVHMAGFSSRLSGLLTLFGSTILMCVGLAEMTCYIGATSGDAITVRVVSTMIPALQHAYPIVAAPMVFWPLGIVILVSHIISKVLGYAAILLGTVFAVLGFIGMLQPVQGIVDTLSALQGFWWLAAAVTFMVRKKTDAAAPSVQL